VGDEDPSVLVGERKVLVIAGVLGVDLARRADIVTVETQGRCDIPRDIVIQIDAGQGGYAERSRLSRASMRSRSRA